MLFFFWRPIKDDSVPPYVFFSDDQRKPTVLHHMFFSITSNIKSYKMFYLVNKHQCYPYVYFHDDQKERQCYPLFFFPMMTNKRRQCYPLCFFSGRPNKTTVLPLMVLFFSLCCDTQWSSVKLGALCAFFNPKNACSVALALRPLDAAYACNDARKCTNAQS